MNKNPYKKLLLALIYHYGTQTIYRRIKINYPFLLKEINTNSIGRKFSEKCYNYLHNVKKVPMCIECGNEHVKFRSYNKGYSIFCSRRCASNNKSVINSRLITLATKYNITCFFKK